MMWVRNGDESRQVGTAPWGGLNIDLRIWLLFCPIVKVKYLAKYSRTGTKEKDSVFEGRSKGEISQEI